MNTKLVAVKQIYLFRHGRSRANNSSDRKMLFPEFFKIMNSLIGFNPTLKTVQLVDKLRQKHTPYEQSDNLIPLMKIGRKQAKLTGQVLAENNITPDLILCSDYLRTRQTTQGIIKGIRSINFQDLTPKVIFSELIVERNGGNTSGFPKDYFRALFPDTDEDFHTKPRYEFRPPGGESILDIRYKRIPPLLEIINAFNFNTLFIVGHGLTNSCIRSLLTGEDIAKIRIGSPNLGVYRFWFDFQRNIWLLDPDFDGSKPISEKVPLTE